eukprot:snap_masked-scaffold_55-processed-gene-0.37-mRNA-1 protein AED:1.00 eAED:1.00 QI:0/-1/0/0/-1/1/1/0/82
MNQEYGFQILNELNIEEPTQLEENYMKVRYQGIESLERKEIQYLKITEIIRHIPKISISQKIACSLLDAEEYRLSRVREKGK